MDISRLQQFYCGFTLDTPVGNNAFSFDQRQCQKILVPPLINGNAEDLAVGTEPAFVEIVDWEDQVCPGLKNFIHTDLNGKPAFIFDNHNHAFFFWMAALEQGVISKGTTLVHVDQHRDTRVPGSWLELGRQSPGLSTEDIFHYTNNTLNVGNFIPPALKLGIFREVIQVGSPQAFDLDLSEPFVLDIDLDIFAPVMAYIPESLKIERLRAWSRQAALVTMATSPFFMDQAAAIGFARQVLRP